MELYKMLNQDHKRQKKKECKTKIRTNNKQKTVTIMADINLCQ